MIRVGKMKNRKGTKKERKREKGIKRVKNELQ
jgi:hypothetical protein